MRGTHSARGTPQRSQLEGGLAGLSGVAVAAAWPCRAGAGVARTPCMAMPGPGSMMLAGLGLWPWSGRAEWFMS